MRVFRSTTCFYEIHDKRKVCVKVGPWGASVLFCVFGAFCVFWGGGGGGRDVGAFSFSDI